MAEQRPLDADLRRDLRNDMSYERYLCLDSLLTAQQPRSDPEHPDELVFIIQHQVSELWFKLAIHEVRAAIAHLAAGDADRCLKNLARLKRIQHQLFEQWSVLETLTPIEYAGYRRVLGSGSGFQSPQYRILEFLLGNKDRRMLEFFAHSRASRENLERALEQPSLYDEFLRYLARRGHPIPPPHLDRDWTEPHRRDPELVPILQRIYEDPTRHWIEYRLCEKLVDIEEQFQLWRFRHMKAVERIIGSKPGTAGSTGVRFLKAALDLAFFPELLEVRGELGT